MKQPKKEERILQGLYSSLYSTPLSVGVTNSNSYPMSSTAKEYGSLLVVPYAGKEKSITFSSFFPYYKSQKILSKRN